MYYASTPVAAGGDPNYAAYVNQLLIQGQMGQGSQASNPYGTQPFNIGGYMVSPMASPGNGISGDGITSGGGGSGSVSPYDLPGQYLKAYNEARDANEQRYNDILTGYQQRTDRMMQNQLGSQGDILGGYEQRYQRGMQNLEGLGSQEKKDLEQSYKNLGAQQRQQLTSRGLTGSTILPTMETGVERQKQDALSRVNERLQRERLGYDASLSGDALGAQERQYGLTNQLYGNLTGDTLGFAERRSDTYPDFNQLAALAQQYGAAGGSFGGGGMAGAPSYVTPQQLGYQIPGMGGGWQGGNWAQPWWFQPMGFGAPNRGGGIPNPAGVEAMESDWDAATAGSSGGSTVVVPGDYGTDADFNAASASLPPELVRMYGPAAASLYQKAVSVLGHPPTSFAELMSVVDGIDVLSPPG